jgi:hypothetical protein
MMGMMGVRMNLLYVSARLFMNIVECRSNVIMTTLVS